MEIQSLVNSDPMGATVDHGSGKMAIEVPSQQFVVSQTKNRIMSLNEKKQRSINKSTNFNPVGLARRCFYGPGVKHVASHSTHTVVANPKKPTRTCKLCSQ